MAALGVLTTGRSGADGPAGRYLVARRSLPPGTRLATGDVHAVAAELPPSVAARVFDDPSVLLGSLTLAPLAEGEFIQAGAVLPRSSRRTDAVPAHEFSFAVGRARAVDGDLRSGERVDLLATYGVDQGGYTTVVAQGAMVLAVEVHGSDLGAPETVVVTVGLADPDAVLAVTHAATADALTIIRSPAPEDPSGSPAGSYQPPGPTVTTALQP